MQLGRALRLAFGLGLRCNLSLYASPPGRGDNYLFCIFFCRPHFLVMSATCTETTSETIGPAWTKVAAPWRQLWRQFLRQIETNLSPDLSARRSRDNFEDKCLSGQHRATTPDTTPHGLSVRGDNIEDNKKKQNTYNPAPPKRGIKRKAYTSVAAYGSGFSRLGALRAVAI